MAITFQKPVFAIMLEGFEGSQWIFVYTICASPSSRKFVYKPSSCRNNISIVMMDIDDYTYIMFYHIVSILLMVIHDKSQ